MASAAESSFQGPRVQLLLWNDRLLSSLRGWSCHVPYRVKVTPAALGRAAGWRDFHTCHVSFTRTSGLDIVPLGSGEECVWTRQTLGPQILRDGPWAIIAHHDSHVQPDFMEPAFQHSAVTSTVGRVRTRCADPKDTEGVSKGKPNQITSPNPKQSDLPHRSLSRNNKISSFFLS